MISFEEALQLIEDNLPEPVPTTLAIEAAVDHVLADEIISSLDVVPYRNSSMDGYAIQAEWIATASATKPVSLSCDETLFAGDTTMPDCRHGVALKIMTGAPVPEGYDAVVKVEDTASDGGQVTFAEPVKVGLNIRQAGEDITKGQKLFKRGYRLRALDTGILASLGLVDVPVYARPSALIACTGNELAAPGEPLGFGQVYNSNLYAVSSLLRPLVSSLAQQATVADDLDSLKTFFEADHDLIVTTGGVSMGDRDLVAEAAEAVGWQRVFHKIAVKPGKPVYFARRGRQVLFGLPGNPLSAVVTSTMFVIPAIRKMSGRQDFLTAREPASLGDSKPRPNTRTLVWPGKLHRSVSGLVGDYSPKNSSQALTAVSNSDGLIIQSPCPSPEENPPKIEAMWWRDLLD